jgi:hypothetical protein
MWFSSWLRNWSRPAAAAGRHTQPSRRQPADDRPWLETLDDRWLPSGLPHPTAAPGSQLIADSYADKTGGAFVFPFLSKKTPARKIPGRAHRFLPKLDALEDRSLMSVSVNFAAGVLTLTGDRFGVAADRVDVTYDGAGNVSGTATGLAGFHQSGVKKLIIDTKGGRDTVTFNQIFSQIQDFSLDVRLGDDSDSFVGSFQGDIAAGRTVDVRVNGGGGSDLITVDASANVGVQPGARLSVTMDTGSGNTDKMAFAYGGRLQGTLDLFMFGNAGDNTLTATIGLDAGSTGRVIARQDAGRGDDRLLLAVSDFSAASIDASMDGGRNIFGGGNDTGTHTTNVRAFGLEHNNVITFQ